MVPHRFRIVFVLLLLCASAGPAYAQYGFHFGRNKIQYDNFDWHVLKTTHFDVYYYPQMQELAEHGAFFAEEAYEDLQNRFDFSLGDRVPIIFYASNLHFKETNVTPGFIPDGVGGFFEFLKGRVVIPANGDLNRFRRVVRHELVHVFTYNRAIRVLRDHRIPLDRFLPLWFTEGLAEYWSGEPDEMHHMVLRDAVSSNYLVPLENMYRISGSFQMYKEGEALFHFISETYGEEKILAMIENLWMDRDFRKVMAFTLKEDYQTLDDKWQAWLKKKYYPELQDEQIASLFTGALSAKGFSAKPSFYRFADGRRKVYFVGNRTGYTNVYEVAVDSLFKPLGDARVLIRGERTGQFEAFHVLESRISISNDGKLAFVTKSGESDVVHVYDLEAHRMGPTYQFDTLIAIYSPDWSPDGKRLVFSSIDEGGFADLYTFDTETGTLDKLTNDLYDDRDPAWSPDGRYVAFSSDRTAEGKDNAYNIFTYDLQTDQIHYVTYGMRLDYSPRWSPGGDYLVFTSTEKDSLGDWGPQNIWMVDSPHAGVPATEVASASPSVEPDLLRPDGRPRVLRQLTRLTTAAFDPVWARDDEMVYTSFEHYRFTVRSLSSVDSLMTHPRREEVVTPSAAGAHWAFGRIGIDQGAKRVPYKRRYSLDIAQGSISQNPVWGTTGGAVLSFSDMLGNDHWFVSMYNNSQGTSDFLKSLNVAVSRYQLRRRTNLGYGAYRLSGLRYDITDPDASAEFPILWETIWGGSGLVSYPISKFRRIEIGASVNWSDKEIPIRDIHRKALLISNSISLVHDNALYGLNGPQDGWRANVTAAYTTDVLYSNVSYYSIWADVRHYQRLARNVTFASWFLGRMNRGREARLFVLGGSWDLRGFPLFDVRGQKMWFTSHELRFPILTAPSLYLPVLAPFGIANLRGALFFDAAHVWNDDYKELIPQINAGETLGATGLGFRLNLFGGFVLRYDLGWRFRDGFRHRDRFFKQFFFGFDF